MLKDPKAIEIIQHARQSNVARPDRPDFDFVHLFSDFLPKDLAGQKILDLGPGQYDFARMVRTRNGICDNIDNDPAVLELGRYLGFSVIEADLSKFDPTPFANQYDGLFCKGSLNVYWLKDGDNIRPFVKALDAMLRPGGWGWIAPWNGATDKGTNRSWPNLQEEAFRACGWSVFRPTPQEAQYYGIGYTVDEVLVFSKNLLRRPSLTPVSNGNPQGFRQLLRDGLRQAARKIRRRVGRWV